MPTLGIRTDESGAPGVTFLPGSRVEYQGALHKVVGVYAVERTQFVILRSLGFRRETFPVSMGAARPAGFSVRPR